MRITTIKLKELNDIFINSGLNKNDFKVIIKDEFFLIQCRGQYFSFKVQIQNPNIYRNTIYNIDNRKGVSVASKWEVTKEKFKDWCESLKTEIGINHGWETIESTNYFKTTSEDLNSSFPEPEKISLRLALKGLQEKISHLELPEKNLDIINGKLDNLDTKLDSMSKFDWKSLFIGTIFSLLTTLAIPQEASGLIWSYISESFKNFRLK